MRRWKRTSLEWHFEPDIITRVPVTDSEYLDQKEFHSLRSIEAVSYPDREGEIEFQIFRSGVGVTTEAAKIQNLLLDAVTRAAGKFSSPKTGVRTDIRMPHVFVIEFALANKVQFCEFALEVVKCSLEGLLPPVSEEISKQTLASFKLNSVLFVECSAMAFGVYNHKVGWTPYENFLKLKSGLPGRRLFVPPRKRKEFATF